MPATIYPSTRLHLEPSLLASLRDGARRAHQSLDVFVELLLRRAMSADVPNATTVAAIEEARSYEHGAECETYDNVDDMMRALMR